jgi:UDP-glucose 4-epimerase
MKFVVTGGAGFIGSHIVKYLISEGYQTVVIDNTFRGRMENLEGVQDKIDFIKMDILDDEKLRKNLQDIDGVFHQAALTSVPESYEKEEQYKLVNVVGTENIFKIAKEFSFKVVYASSSSVYGNTDKMPISENTERKPINPYGLTKLEDELLAEKYATLGTKIIGLRYFNVYGKGQTLDYAGVITKFLENIKNNKHPVIFGDGLQSRDFVFVKDVAKANLSAMLSSVNHGFFNIGTGMIVTIKELAELMIKISGKNLNLVFDKLPQGDVKSSQADVTLAKNHLDWEFETSLEEGLTTLFS